MKIEDLVEKFLIKDSESNIQMMSQSNIDFSGFTQSTIAIEKTPNKHPVTNKAPVHGGTQKNIFSMKDTQGTSKVF